MEIDSYDARDAVENPDGVHLAQLAAGDRASVQHFRIEPGAGVETHSHEHEQLGFVNEGELVFTVGGEERIVEADDAYVIPADEPHAAENRGDDAVVGIEVFAPARQTPPWTEEGDS
ncbi:cupin domain-containing protein [Haladaptatus sp. NG-WS-4]